MSDAPKSEFHQLHVFAEDPAAPDLAAAIEFVPNAERPREIYLVIDGERVAYRGNRAWVPMVPGFHFEPDIRH
jgi:hypothetical protein